MRLFAFAIRTVATVMLPPHTATGSEYLSRTPFMNETKEEPSRFGWVVPFLVFLAFVLVFGFWWVVWEKIEYVDMNELGVLFSGLAFAAVFSALLVQWRQFLSTQAQVIETQDQLGMQTIAMQEQVLAMQGQVLQLIVEAKVSALEDSVAALQLQGGVSQMQGRDLLEWVTEGARPDGLSLLGVGRFASARRELEDLGRLLKAFPETPVRRANGEAPGDLIELLRARVENTLEATPAVPKEWNPSNG